jgi:hypothetical protein
MKEYSAKEWIHPSFSQLPPPGSPSWRATTAEALLKSRRNSPALSLGICQSPDHLDMEIRNFLRYREGQRFEGSEAYAHAFAIHEDGATTGLPALIMALAITGSTPAGIATALGVDFNGIDRYLRLYCDVHILQNRTALAAIVFPFKRRDLTDPAALRDALILIAAHDGGRSGLMRLFTPKIGLTRAEHQQLAAQIPEALAAIKARTDLQMAMAGLPEEAEQRLFWETEEKLLSLPLCDDPRIRTIQFERILRGDRFWQERRRISPIESGVPCQSGRGQPPLPGDRQRFRMIGK